MQTKSPLLEGAVASVLVGDHVKVDVEVNGHEIVISRFPNQSVTADCVSCSSMWSFGEGADAPLIVLVLRGHSASDADEFGVVVHPQLGNHEESEPEPVESKAWSKRKAMARTKASRERRAKRDLNRRKARFDMLELDDDDQE